MLRHFSGFYPTLEFFADFSEKINEAARGTGRMRPVLRLSLKSRERAARQKPTSSSMRCNNSIAGTWLTTEQKQIGKYGGGVSSLNKMLSLSAAHYWADKGMWTGMALSLLCIKVH
jgi:hypothetical protein